MHLKNELLKSANLYLILDRQVNDSDQLFEIAQAAIKAGVGVMQLRDKFGSATDVLSLAKRISAIVPEDVLFIVNDRTDIALTSGANGVHLGQDDMSIEQAKQLLGPESVIGISCQTLEQARDAERRGADYIGFGSVFKTKTKPERNPMDMILLQEVLRTINIPVFFIGGINLKNAEQIHSLGVNQIAVCRAISEAEDVQQVVGKFNQLLGCAKDQLRRVCHGILCLFVLLLSGCTALPTVPNDFSAPPPSKPKRIGVYHKVKKGETIWRIAKTYNVPIDKIISSNNIPNVAKVEKNQLVFIPGVYRVKEIYIATDAEDEKEFIWPVKGKVLSYYKDRKGRALNKGIDIKARHGQKVKAARSGRVVFADYLSNYGQTLVIDHNDGFHTVYAHNSKLLVKLGDLVFKNNEVAQIGSQNNLAFLHFQIRKNSKEDNPLYYLP